MDESLKKELQILFKERFSEKDLDHYGKDWTQGFRANPSAVVFPKTTKEVGSILKLCSQYRQAVVPSGGRTGLAAAAFAENHELVVSLEKMNNIIEINPENSTISVESGVPTQVVQEAATREGLFFALDLAAKGSSQIGGNIATNAGGTKFIKYGGMREQVLGLEVVLANGDILDINNSLRKDNSGYDLKHLFIGSEGTLGIITKATLKLSPPPKDRGLCLLALNKFLDAVHLLKRCYQSSITPTAFEYISKNAMDFSSENKPPFGESHDHYVLVEFEKEANSDNFIERAFEEGLCIDGAIADSSARFHELWAYREKITERIAESSYVHKNDISLSVANLNSFVEFISRLDSGKIKIVLFGHVGDGNIHVNYTAPKTTTNIDEFKSNVIPIERQISDFLKSHSGSISAEHGIGLLKKGLLAEFVSPLKIEIMRKLKRTLDPLSILNPGKIFDP